MGNHYNSRLSRGFTLIELLVVIGIITVLLGLLLPTMSKSRQAARKAACAANVQQICAALISFAGENEQKLPSYQANGPLGQYLWDLPTDARNKLMTYGLLRKNFYCNANPGQDNGIFWPYHSNSTWTVTGYMFFIPRPSWSPSILDATYPLQLPNGQNDTHHDVGQRLFPYLHGQHRTSEYEMVADAVMASNGTFNTANEAAGTTTSHIDGNKPQGGNIGYQDGHVAWKPFSEMYRRIGPPVTGPDHYW